jgi:cobalamin biosynthesis protein CobT
MSRKNKQPKIETPIIESESVSQVPSFIEESSEVLPEVESDQVLSTQSSDFTETIEKVTEEVAEEQKGDAEPTSMPVPQPVKRDRLSFSDMLRNRRKPK